MAVKFEDGAMGRVGIGAELGERGKFEIVIWRNKKQN